MTAWTPEREAAALARLAGQQTLHGDLLSHVVEDLSDALAALAAWRDLAQANERLLALYRVGAGSGDRRAPKVIDAITDAKVRLRELGQLR